MRIVVAGDSPLAFLVARELDQDLARHAHIDVSLITRDPKVTFRPSVLEKVDQPLKKKLLKNCEVVVDEVKGINLRERRLVLGSDVIDYDALFLDQTPAYTTDQLKAVERSLTELIAHVKAKKETPLSARVTINGQHATSWQLALSITEAVRHLRPAISIEAELSIEKEICRYLENCGLHHLSNRRRPGFRVTAPTKTIDSARIRGLTVDLNGRAVVDRSWSPPRHPEVIILDNEMRSLHLSWRPDSQLAKRVVRSLEARLEKRSTDFEPLAPAMILTTSSGKLLYLGDTISWGLRAAAVWKLEKNFWQSLTRGNR